MPKMRHFVLPLVILATPFGCAAVADPDPSKEGEATATGDELDSMDEDDSMRGSGGSIVVVSSSSGGASSGNGSMGGASASGSSSGTGGSSGPVLLPSCYADDECDDKSSCTDDTCSARGLCQFADNATCECTAFNAATACDDANPCTDDSCDGNTCAYTNNTASCDDDGNACTQNICDAGSCTHPDGGLCTDATVILRSVRDGFDGQWITVNTAGLLVWNVASAGGQAALFDRIDGVDTTFTLKDVVTGLFVTLDVDDNLAATSSEENAAIFDTTACPLAESTAVGIHVTTDDDGGNFAAAEPGGELKARSGGCTPASATAWERFEISPAGG